MKYRKLNANEGLFVESLLDGNAEYERYILQLRTAEVIDLKAQYCLKFFLEMYNYEDVEIFGSNMLQKQILDTDNVLILISLDLDTKGNLYELDIWKTDFSDILINVFSDSHRVSVINQSLR